MTQDDIIGLVVGDPAQETHQMLQTVRAWKRSRLKKTHYECEVFSSGSSGEPAGGYAFCRGIDLCVLGVAIAFLLPLKTAIGTHFIAAFSNWCLTHHVAWLDDTSSFIYCIGMLIGIVVGATFINTPTMRAKMRLPVIGVFTLLSYILISFTVLSGVSRHGRNRTGRINSQELSECIGYFSDEAVEEYTASTKRITDMQKKIADTLASLKEMIAGLGLQIVGDTPVSLLSEARMNEGIRITDQLQAQAATLSHLQGQLDVTIAPLNECLKTLSELKAAQESMERISVAHAVRFEADETIKITVDSLAHLRLITNNSAANLESIRGQITSVERAHEEVRALTTA